MNESQALKFWRDWKSPVRKTLLSPSPKKCSSSPKHNELKNKSIEKAGRYNKRKEFIIYKILFFNFPFICF